MFFAIFTVKAADQTVNIDGLTIAGIQTGIQNAIAAVENNGVVTVTGTASWLNAGTGGISIEIPSNVSVLWKASFTGRSSAETSLVNIIGGDFEVTADGKIEQSYEGYAITTNGNITVSGGSVSSSSFKNYTIWGTGESSVVKVSGGTVSRTSGDVISIAGEKGSVVVSGGEIHVNAGGVGNTIYAEGANSTVTVSGGSIMYGKISTKGVNSVVTVSGGTVSGIITTGESSIVSVSGGKVINSNGRAIDVSGAKSKIVISGTARVQGTAMTIYFKGNVEVKENAQVIATGTNSAIYTEGENNIITVSGGTVSSTGGNAIYNNGTNGNVIISGGTITTEGGIAIDAAGSVIVSGNGKVIKSTTTSYTVGAIRAVNVEVKENAEITYNNGAAITASGSGTVTVSGGTLKGGNSGTIYTTGRNNKVIVSGGIVSSSGHAIYTFGTGSTVTICENGKVEGGYYGDAIWATGNVEVKDNAEVKAGTANRAIFSRGATVTVSGGIISSSVRAILMNGANSNIIVNGGKVSTTSGRAIENTGTNGKVTISGGMVNATSGYAIAVTEADSKITISGGVVFAYEPVISMKNESNFIGVSGTGVIIGWNQAAGNTSYSQGSANDLSMLPAGCAKWDKVSEDGGITYENGINKGFIALEDITITKGNGITTPQTGLLQIYPNPVTTELHIKLDTQETVDYSIYNNVGQLVMQGKLQNESIINVQSLPIGIYYLKTVGKENATTKFIKN